MIFPLLFLRQSRGQRDQVRHAAIARFQTSVRSKAICCAACILFPAGKVARPTAIIAVPKPVATTFKSGAVNPTGLALKLPIAYLYCRLARTNLQLCKLIQRVFWNLPSLLRAALH